MLEHIDLAPVPDAAQLLDDARADADAFGQKLNTTYDYAAPIARQCRRSQAVGRHQALLSTQTIAQILQPTKGQTPQTAATTTRGKQQW
jgi:hypothetical protein